MQRLDLRDVISVDRAFHWSCGWLEDHLRTQCTSDGNERQRRAQQVQKRREHDSSSLSYACGTFHRVWITFEATFAWTRRRPNDTRLTWFFQIGQYISTGCRCVGICQEISSYTEKSGLVVDTVPGHPLLNFLSVLYSCNPVICSARTSIITTLLQ